MDSGDNWIPEDVARWLYHIGIHHFLTTQQDHHVPQQLAAQFNQDLLGAPEICTGLHHPVQVLDGYPYSYCEQSNSYPCSHEGQLTVEPVGRAGEESAPISQRVPEPDMRGSEDVAPGTVLQRLMQEHLRYGGQASDSVSFHSMPQSSQQPIQPAAGSAGLATSNLSSTENLVQEDVPMVQQSARQEPQGQEHQVDNISMEKQVLRVAQPQQNNEELPTYEEAKAQSQLFRGQQTGPGYFVASSTPQKVRTEGRSAVSRANTGPTHKDEALKELKQGHVRSLSERIMQMSLERNGARQQVPACSSSSLPSQTTSAKGMKNSAAVSSQQTAAKGGDPRGPPPEYPFKNKPSMTSVTKAQEGVPCYSEAQSALVPETPKAYCAPPPSKAGVAVLKCLSPPEYGARACQPPYQTVTLRHHSPMPSPASSMSGSLPPSSLFSPSPLLVPANQHLPGDAFAVVARAQQMVEILSEENRALRQELEVHYEKAAKLQKFEREISKISEAYDNLVRSTSRRESLDIAMKNKLEGEIRRLLDFNRDLRDRLETANRQLANKDHDGSDGQWTDGPCPSQGRDNSKEKLEWEVASLRSANEDQRRHIEILDQALNNAQANVVRLEDELRKKQVYVDKVERLQQALTQLQAACEKREQLERRLRTRLERELEALRAQQRQGGTPTLPSAEVSAPALMELLREKEERILGLEADMTKWEQKYLEESAMRHFAMDAAATAAAERDTTIINHSRNGSYSENCQEARGIWQEEEEISLAGRRCQDMEHRIKNLHAQIIEKDAMIKVLQQRSRKIDAATLRPARSVPSISAAAGQHLRQNSQTSSQIPGEKKEERTWKGSVGRLLGKENADHPHPVPQLPTLSSTFPPSPLISTHVKTGSKDNSTQTDKSPEAPRSNHMASRIRLSNTPTGSPVLRHQLGKLTTEKLDASPSLMKYANSKPLGTRPDLPDTEVVEILI
ncbi:angiomotin-like protein 1 [Erpetoichthys calabaricus]|uniref:Angiomotin like 1 n=1 Tax=Erpetoichthys calabaricus TaxID=27687 RepID=A0A8C4RJY8_ERPCA|nr:angiomotin-like protein 1 [Erpetoichthys calabaricus]